MTQASADFDRAASNIARSSVPTRKPDASAVKTSPQEDTVDLSTSMVDLLQARNDFEANTRTFRISDEMNRTVLDMIL